MNPTRLTAFMLAYVDGLQEAIKHHAHRYALLAWGFVRGLPYRRIELKLTER
jgi:hypothetical protein